MSRAIGISMNEAAAKHWTPPMTERKEAVRADADPVIVAACMGMDAFRMSIGLPTRNYTPELVAEWIASRVAARPLSSTGDGEK